MESLFTNVPLNDTIEYILHQIYVEKKLPKLCSKLIFKRLLYKLTTENTFIFQSNFYKQIDGCTMGGPLSVIIADIFMTKLEEAVVKPLEPKFYKRYVDDIICRRYKNQQDVLFDKINSYHTKISFTIEVEPSTFLDTKLVKENPIYKTEVYRKSTKFPVHWSSKIPKRYKRNAINGDLNRSKCISSDFEKEKTVIVQKFKNADFPERFIKSVINNYESNQISKAEEDELLIPSDFFEIKKPFILIEIPYCEKNEKLSKRFMAKLNIFTKNYYDIAIKWITKKVRQLFPLKDKNPHPACKIYEGCCSCGFNYMGETIRNVETRWREHNNVNMDSEPAKHLKEHIDHSFTWKVIMTAPKNFRLRKNLEASIIALKRPRLNDQLDFNKLTLIRNGVT